MTPWKRIGVALKSGQAGVEPLLRRIVAEVSEHGLELILEHEAARVSDSDSDSALEQVAARADLLIVLGGDGSMLAAARAIGERDVAILGINVGRLGFLADVSPDEVDAALAAVLGGDYRIRERSRELSPAYTTQATAALPTGRASGTAWTAIGRGIIAMQVTPRRRSLS